MCYPVTCANCGNTGWGGCGRHLDTVMSSVPTADRCTCRQDTTPVQDQRRTLRSFFRR
ncbi:hypothetical protein MLGJGCBP_01775 [Rhodococcus sp. T7]|uniref:Uncharacterized protein n=2 Tax=Rhodococcus opacus TaxID=37919 RepID=C1BD94_RHOOB|nr:hypothetical protein W59_08149 [Rhodococcus opacus RKJ300 = JCM 13270]KAF0957511.1 hypothetical protein MLGJGCBP_09343 [Rhodococcus sp. T7]KAF0965081.1 hypothetical protein MLGJGCBP_01775 [Rhodococcus sp. T7]BAH55838.1 hypothetical protein ROP_pROB01-03390 [Rhodococcus opacus B4]